MIEVEQLTKVYGTTRAVEGLNFTVARGEIVGLLGPNGAGKSTTMRILAGSLSATTGRVRIGGTDVLSEPKKTKRQVGYLPEAPPLYAEMRVLQYLRFCARIKQVPEPDPQIELVMRRTGLHQVGHRIIDHLSKGYRQRVGLAQALVHSPKVLILDEPASGLDPAQRVEIRNLVRELSDGDVTVILSTHVLPEVEALCDRVIIVREGRIVAESAVDELVQGRHTIQLTVARPEPALADRFRALAGVTEVAEPSSGVFTLTATEDVREQAAHAAVPSGLLELRQSDGLEQVYLELTHEDPAL